MAYTIGTIASELNKTVGEVKDGLGELILNLIDSVGSPKHGALIDAVLSEFDGVEGSDKDKLEKIYDFVPEMNASSPVPLVIAKIILGDKYVHPENNQRSSNGGMSGDIANIEATALAILKALPDSYRAEIQARQNQAAAAIELKYTTAGMTEVLKGEAIKRQVIAKMNNAIYDLEVASLMEAHQESQKLMANLLGVNYRLTNESNKRANEAQDLADSVTAQTTSFLSELESLSNSAQSKVSDMLSMFKKKPA
jgi:hypothetical protein